MNLIRFRNGPTKVTLMNGMVIQKSAEEFVFVPEYKAMIRKAPYFNQFIFELPKSVKGPSYMCSCGGMCVVAGSKAYAHLGSPEGMMLVCYAHTTTGKHADGSS